MNRAGTTTTGLFLTMTKFNSWHNLCRSSSQDHKLPYAKSDYWTLNPWQTKTSNTYYLKAFILGCQELDWKVYTKHNVSQLQSCSPICSYLNLWFLSLSLSPSVVGLDGRSLAGTPDYNGGALVGLLGGMQGSLLRVEPQWPLLVATSDLPLTVAPDLQWQWWWKDRGTERKRRKIVMGQWKVMGEWQMSSQILGREREREIVMGLAAERESDRHKGESKRRGGRREKKWGGGKGMKERGMGWQLFKFS